MSVTEQQPPKQAQQALYLLDTNIISYFVRGEYEPLARTMIASMARYQCAVSVITYAELQYGNALKPVASESRQRIDLTLAHMPILPWTVGAADQYAQLKAQLRQRGRPIGELDTQIAAHALAENLTLVTHNTRHFEGVVGLSVEDWTL